MTRMAGGVVMRRGDEGLFFFGGLSDDLRISHPERPP
jgi:hypothetical protein